MRRIAADYFSETLMNADITLICADFSFYILPDYFFETLMNVKISVNQRLKKGIRKKKNQRKSA